MLRNLTVWVGRCTMPWLMCAVACHAPADEPSASAVVLDSSTEVSEPVRRGAVCSMGESASKASEEVLFSCCPGSLRLPAYPHPDLPPLPLPRQTLSSAAPLGPDDPAGCVVDYAPVGPAPTTSAADLQQFTLALQTIYRSPESTARQIKDAQTFLAAQDQATLVPAWINALIGLDLREPHATLTAAHMVLGFHESVAGTPIFFVYPGDGPHPYGGTMLERRIAIINLFHDWWADKRNNEKRFDIYRKKLQEILANREMRLDKLASP